MERPVITISHEDDGHIELVEQHLDRPIVVIDPTATANDSDSELSYEFIDGHDRLVYKGEDVSDAVSVWYRKPHSLERHELPLAEKYKDYSLSALQKHTRQLHAQLPEAFWVSDYHAIQRANNKTLQYKLAHDLGMNVPDTLMTTNQAAAKEFLDPYPVSIVKTLATFFTTNDNDEPLAFFARKIHRGESVDLSGLNFAPAVFQEAIDAAVDVRVTVVGDTAFATLINSTGISDEAVRDWRAGHFEGTMEFEACNDLPPSVLESCIEHVRRLGLNYGAIDLVIANDGKIWFLENNPNGQWGFVEQMTGQPIGKAMAELLQAGQR